VDVHVSFKDVSPEKRAEMVAKSVATRRAKREAQQAERLVKSPFDLPRQVEILEEDADDVLLRTAELEDVKPPAPNAEERRRRLTADLPAEIAALITDDQLEQIERRSQERARAARLKEALRDIEALADAEAKIAHGLIPADVLRSEREKAEMNEWGHVRVNLPPGGGALGLRVDGRLLRNGETSRVTRAQYNSMLYTHYKAHIAEIRFSALNQDKRGNSAVEIITRNPPAFEFIPE
jgi:phage-related minor tail protein